MKKILEGMGLLFKILDKKKTKKRLKELKERKEARRVQTEKDLKYSDTRPSPTITKTEAIATSTAKKEALIQKRKEAETKWIIPIKDRVIKGEHSGNQNPYGHGKGLGAKIERIIGTTKASVQKNRQRKRENEQVAKQRRRGSVPAFDRREVKRPKSGLYKDTPKNKKPPWL